MGDDARPKGPFVLNIRMSGRLVPFAAGLTVFAVLPFLGGSTPDPARADVVLAAGSPAEVAVQDAVGVVDAARQGLAGQGTGPCWVTPSPWAAATPPSAATRACSCSRRSAWRP